MTNLQVKLNDMRAAFASKVPEDTRAMMHRATEDLRASGLADRAKSVGDRIPSFALPDASGKTIRSEDVLAKGPAILSFFRGHW